MTTLFLAYSANSNATATYPKIDFETFPLGLLVSFVYKDDFFSKAKNWTSFPQKTMLDSGAFSAWNSGMSINIDALIEEARKTEWKEIIALDVVGDAEQGLKNALYMKAQGLEVVPVFHIGESYEILAEYCKQFSKVGLSCRFGEPENLSLKWLEQCFARSYPHRFHSFGWMKEKMLLEFPFHTADASSWAVQTSRFGNWSAYGKLPVRNYKIDLLSEVNHYEKMQKRIRFKWRNEIEKGNI